MWCGGRIAIAVLIAHLMIQQTADWKAEETLKRLCIMC
jgi:hypothetical protein